MSQWPAAQLTGSLDNLLCGSSINAGKLQHAFFNEKIIWGRGNIGGVGVAHQTAASKTGSRMSCEPNGWSRYFTVDDGWSIIS